MLNKLTTTNKTLVLGIAFELVWLALIMSASTDYYWLGITVGLVAYFAMLPDMWRANMIGILFVTSLLGFGFDILNQYLGIITLTNTPLSFSWLLVLWLVFVGIFYQLFFWLSKLSSLSSFVLGMLGGTGSYYGASLLGAVTINDWSSFVLLYSLFWGTSFSIAAKIVIARKLTAKGRQTS